MHDTHCSGSLGTHCQGPLKDIMHMEVMCRNLQHAISNMRCCYTKYRHQQANVHANYSGATELQIEDNSSETATCLLMHYE